MSFPRIGLVAKIQRILPGKRDGNIRSPHMESAKIFKPSWPVSELIWILSAIWKHTH